MRRSRFRDEQMSGVLREVAGGGWRQGAGGVLTPWHHRADVLPMEAEFRRSARAGALRLKAIEEENRRLKRLVADQALNIPSAEGCRGKRTGDGRTAADSRRSRKDHCRGLAAARVSVAGRAAIARTLCRAPAPG
jgi:hypothetical protein